MTVNFCERSWMTLDYRWNLLPGFVYSVRVWKCSPSLETCWRNPKVAVLSAISVSGHHTLCPRTWYHASEPKLHFEQFRSHWEHWMLCLTSTKYSVTRCYVSLNVVFHRRTFQCSTVELILSSVQHGLVARSGMWTTACGFLQALLNQELTWTSPSPMLWICLIDLQICPTDWKLDKAFSVQLCSVLECFYYRLLIRRDGFHFWMFPWVLYPPTVSLPA